MVQVFRLPEKYKNKAGDPPMGGPPAFSDFFCFFLKIDSDFQLVMFLSTIL